MNDTSPPSLRSEIEQLRARVAQLEAEVAEGDAAKKQLNFLEARRQSHLSKTPLALIYWDPQFRVLEWNPAAERIFGYTAEEAIGKHGCDLIVATDTRQQVEEVFAHLLERSGGERSRNENITKGGQRILCDWYNTPVVDDEGKIVGAASIAQDITEQYENAEALRQSEGLLRSIVENAPNAILVLDREGRITFVNRITADYSRETILGQPAAELAAPEDRDVIRRAVERVFATGQPEEYEVRDVIQRRWYFARLAPVMEDGKVTSAVVISLDIHDRREQEAALRESENRLRMVTEQIPAVMWTTDTDLRFTSSIGAALETMGLQQNEVVGRTLAEFFQTDDTNFPPLKAATQALAGESINYRQEWGDRWYQVHTEALRDAAGEITGVIGVALDVTQQKQAEIEREKSKRIFEILAKNVPGVVYLCKNDARYTMLYLNDAVEKLVGIPAKQFLDDHSSFVELYHPDEASSIPSLVDAAITQRAPFRLRYRLRHAEGHWVWVEEHGQGVYDENGELKFLEGYIFDITTKRDAEEALLRSKQELERLVGVRTQELRTANRLLREDYKRQLSLTRESRESEAKFRMMCEQNPGPVTITRESDGEILYANEQVAEMMRTPRDQLIGRSTRSFYTDPTHRERLLAWLAEHGQVRDHELQLQREDGSTFWASMSLQRIRHNNEDALVTILLDITDRKDFEDKLKSQTRMLRRMLVVHDRDRQLIAYEIHDGIVQYMTGVNLFVQAAGAKMNKDPQGAARDLEKGASLVSDTIEEARRMIDGLRPGVLEEHGLIPALEYLCEKTGRFHDIPTTFVEDIDFEQRLAPAVEWAIYRIIQEGLANVVKHSKSKRARAVLSQREDALVIKVEDWGVGFDPKTVQSKRYGLTGIRDRARLLGGKAKIRTAPGEGTLLRVKLPLRDVLLPLGWEQPEAESTGDDSSSDWRIPPSDV